LNVGGHFSGRRAAVANRHGTQEKLLGVDMLAPMSPGDAVANGTLLWRNTGPPTPSRFTDICPTRDTRDTNGFGLR